MNVTAKILCTSLLVSLLTACQSNPNQTENTQAALLPQQPEATTVAIETPPTPESLLGNEQTFFEGEPVAAADEPAPTLDSSSSPEMDLWELTRQNFKLKHDFNNSRVKAQYRFYAKHPRYMARVTDRAKRYYYYVIHEILAAGVPAEVALLPIVESAFDPFAYSHGRAAGPWQFIPGTAKHFGIKRSWWYDGRRDIRVSTQAAIKYLTQLNKRFDGDWYLALAAYNAGEGNVEKAIRKNKKRGKPTDFFSLDLPRETRAYVPKLIALAQIFEDPKKHGITLTPVPNEPYFAVVKTGSQIDLAQAAEMAATSTDELYLLNPGYNRWATDPAGPHELLVPYNNKEIFEVALAELPPEKRLSWVRYKVKSGDSLIRIAKNHHITVKSLKVTNGMKSNLIRVGQTLLIPTASETSQAYTYSADQRQAKKTKTIGLRTGKTKTKYKVRSGDTFWEIAKHNGVGVRQLASWNQMAPGDTLKIGQTLTIWQKAKAGAISSNKASSQLIRKIGYKVRNGDSLWKIANRFNVSINDIQKWNTLSRKSILRPGQKLTLYVDVTKAR